MPILDMPVKELEKYYGKTPCPVDIDEYWDTAIAEAMSIDYNTEFVKSSFNAKNTECYDLYFTGTKGARIHARLVKPAVMEGKTAAVLHFHGLSGSAASWTELLQFINEGFCAASIDCRGQGGISEDKGGVAGTTYSTPLSRGLDGDKHDLYLRDLFLDTMIFAKIIMGLEYVDENRVGVYGGSQGGGLSLVCASLVPEIKKCATYYPYMCDYKRVWEMDLAHDAYEGITYYFRHFDPTHEREDEIFERLGYVDVQNLVKRIKGEVLMFTGLQDRICPPSTQYAAYNKITSKKQHLIYPEYGHETMKGTTDKVYAFLSEL